MVAGCCFPSASRNAIREASGKEEESRGSRYHADFCSPAAADTPPSRSSQTKGTRPSSPPPRLVPPMN